MEDIIDKYGTKCKKCNGGAFQILLKPTPSTPADIARIEMRCISCKCVLELDVKGAKEIKRG